MGEWTVFISHKREDEVIAKAVAKRLYTLGFGYYLDVVDVHLGLDGVDLANYLRGKLSECDALLAVVSESTKNSQWVPWEIGVATEKNYPLSTYLSDQSQIPEFLRKWPVLRSLDDVSQFVFIGELTDDKLDAVDKSVERLADRQDRRRNIVAQFHRELRTKLRQ